MRRTDGFSRIPPPPSGGRGLSAVGTSYQSRSPPSLHLNSALHRITRGGDSSKLRDETRARPGDKCRLRLPGGKMEGPGRCTSFFLFFWGGGQQEGRWAADEAPSSEKPSLWARSPLSFSRCERQPIMPPPHPSPRRGTATDIIINSRRRRRRRGPEGKSNAPYATMSREEIEIKSPGKRRMQDFQNKNSTEIMPITWP